MSIEICEYEAQDVDDSLKQLWLSLAREMFTVERFILPSEENADKWISFIRSSLASGKSFLLVAKTNSKPVGFASGSVPEYPLKVSESFGTIDDLYVLPEFRGRGVGSKLVVESLKTLKARGVKTVRLNVLKENKPAVKLYRRLGFKTRSYGMEKTFRKIV